MNKKLLTLLLILALTSYAGITLKFQKDIPTEVKAFEKYIKKAVIEEKKIMEWEETFKELCKGNEILRDQIYQQVVITLAWFKKGRPDMYLQSLDKLKKNLKALEAVGAGVTVKSEVVKWNLF